MVSDLLPGFRLTLDKDEMDEKQYLTIFTCTPQNDLVFAMNNIIRISEDGTFIMYKQGNMIPKSKLLLIIHNHIDRFTRVNQMSNALALLKNLQVSNTDQIMKTEKVLQSLDLVTPPLDHQQLSFMKMQFDLCQQPANNRRYTSDLLINIFYNALVASCRDLLRLNI